MNRSISVIYSTATGHTEFVVDVMIKQLTVDLPTARIIKQRAEVSTPEDLTKSDVLILACGSWNTGNVEGQMSPYMHDLLTVRAASANLTGVHAAAIGLGDERYFYTARAAEKLTDYMQTHGATLLIPTLKVINDPFGQEKKVATWTAELAQKIKNLPSDVRQ